MMLLRPAGLSLFFSMVLVSTSVFAAPGVRDDFGGSDAHILVVAHRGCHKAAPAHGLPSAPENSLAALENCVRLGTDMMETDVRQTADGELVMIHDDTLDRTTTGSGRVRGKTLAELRALRLRDNLGGKDAAPTDQRIATLDAMLAAARGRMHLNLDVKDAVYVEVIAAVERAGMQDQVIVKTVAGPHSPALSALPPFDRVPFAPILLNAHGDADLGAIVTRQVAGRRPIAIELPEMSPEQLPSVVAHAKGVRLWVNTLWSGFITGWGGDAAALLDPDQVWGRMHRAGISIFQTDEPEALLAFRARQRR
jgi:glycerophosphoryl diester phosphodiesterase